MDNSSNIFRGNPAHTVLDNHTKSPNRGLAWTDETALVEGPLVKGDNDATVPGKCVYAGLSMASMWVDCPSTDSWLCPSVQFGK